MAGAWVGSRLFRRSSEALYRRVALGLLFCVGLYGAAAVRRDGRIPAITA